MSSRLLFCFFADCLIKNRLTNKPKPPKKSRFAFQLKILFILSFSSSSRNVRHLCRLYHVHYSKYAAYRCQQYNNYCYFMVPVQEHTASQDEYTQASNRQTNLPFQLEYLQILLVILISHCNPALVIIKPNLHTHRRVENNNIRRIEIVSDLLI